MNSKKIRSSFTPTTDRQAKDGDSSGFFQKWAER